MELEQLNKNMMKKILMLLMFVAVCSTTIKAQEHVSKIDSIATELNQLKHGYDYLYCEYQLNKLNLELKVFINELKIATNQIISNGYNNNYTDALYNGFKMNYDESVNLYESYQQSFWAVSFSVTSRIENSNFYEQEIKVLKSIAGAIEQAIKSVKLNLDYQKSVLELYREIK